MKHRVITYIVAKLPYSIFHTQYIFQPDLLHMRCRDEQFLMDYVYISGLLYSPMSGLSLKTLRFEGRCRHLCHYRAVIDAQFISVLSRWTDGVSDGLYCMIMTHLFILCYGYYCSYTDFCDTY